MGACTSERKQEDRAVFKSKVKNTYKSTVLVTQHERDCFELHILNSVSKSISNGVFQLKLVFRASQASFSAEAFHESTHNIKNTFFVAKTTDNRVLGAYSPCTWKKDAMYVYETDEKSESFLFYFTSRKIEGLSSQTKKQEEAQFDCKKLKIKDKTKAIMNNLTSGPVFGQGHDVFISDKCNKNKSWCNVGKSYESIYPFGSMKSNCLLVGKSEFLVLDYQIWTIIF